MRLDVGAASTRQRADTMVAPAFCPRRCAAPPHLHRRSRAQADDSFVALREAGSGTRGCGARVDTNLVERTPTSPDVVPCTGWGVPSRSFCNGAVGVKSFHVSRR